MRYKGSLGAACSLAPALLPLLLVWFAHNVIISLCPGFASFLLEFPEPCQATEEAALGREDVAAAIGAPYSRSFWWFGAQVAP